MVNFFRRHKKQGLPANNNRSKTKGRLRSYLAWGIVLVLFALGVFYLTSSFSLTNIFMEFTNHDHAAKHPE